MIAIETRYIGPSNTKGARIAAVAEKHRVTISYPHEAGSSEKAHAVAAKALADKLGWHDEWIGGGVKRGYVFVATGNRGDDQTEGALVYVP